MPSFEEARYCSKAEFNRYIDERLVPELIVPGEDFTFMGALVESEPNDAIAVPVRCKTVPQVVQESGLVVVDFALLDRDMNPVKEPQRISFKVCGLISITPEFKRNNHSVTNGYLRAYDDGLGDGIRSFLESHSFAQIK